MKTLIYYLCLVFLGRALALDRPIGPRKAPRPRQVTDDSRKWVEKYAQAWAKVAETAETNRTFAKLVDDHFKKFNRKPSVKVDYECDLPPSTYPPESAHYVRPSDIRGIGAIGDSITVGMGITAESLIQMIRNDRQEAFASGGIRSLQENMITVPNILRILSPQLSGYSFGRSWAYEIEAGLNVAIPANMAADMYQNAYDFVEKLYYEGSSIGVNWYEDWKLVSLLIGANDLCRYCTDEQYYSPDAYANHIRSALDYLYNEGPPKMIIVISTIFDITPLPAFSEDLICDMVQGFACGCATDEYYHKSLQEAQQGYTEKLEALIATGRYDNPYRPDFTVVLMPHLKDSKPPIDIGTGRVDSSFWAYDCFHPGRKAHFAMATSLWNQLFEPVGQKRTEMDWKMGENLVCPTEESPYIQTRLNGPPDMKKKSPPAVSSVIDNGRQHNSKNGAIIGGTVGGVVVLCAVVAVVMVIAYRKRREDESPLPVDVVPAET